MDFKTIVGCVLVALTSAFVLATLASIFVGRVARMLRSAGFSVVMAGITIFAIQQWFDIPKSGMKGIGWIVLVSGNTLLMMYVIGGTLVVLGALSGMVAPVRMYQAFKSSQSIIGNERRSPSRMALKRQVRAFGKRIVPQRSTTRPDGLKQNND